MCMCARVWCVSSYTCWGSQKPFDEDPREFRTCSDSDSFVKLLTRGAAMDTED